MTGGQWLAAFSMDTVSRGALLIGVGVSLLVRTLAISAVTAPAVDVSTQDEQGH